MTEAFDQHYNKNTYFFWLKEAQLIKGFLFFEFEFVSEKASIIGVQ